MSQRTEEMLHPVLPFAPAAGGACRGTAACADALAKALAGRERVTVVLECYPASTRTSCSRCLNRLALIRFCTPTTARWNPPISTPRWPAT